jgi:hypothetical protein
MEPQAILDNLKYQTKWIIRRYPDQAHFIRKEAKDVPDLTGPPGAMLPAVSVIDHNVLLNAGIQFLLDLAIGGAGNNAPYNAGNARLGVGDSSLAANAAQTGLNAATNKAWGTMANGYPSRNNQTVTWQSSFDANTANFGWQEFTIVNAANDDGININRVANNQGTKVEGQVWTLSVAITLS